MVLKDPGVMEYIVFVGNNLGFYKHFLIDHLGYISYLRKTMTPTQRLMIPDNIVSGYKNMPRGDDQITIWVYALSPLLIVRLSYSSFASTSSATSRARADKLFNTKEIVSLHVLKKLLIFLVF